MELHRASLTGIQGIQMGSPDFLVGLTTGGSRKVNLEHKWQTQDLLAESGPPPFFIWPGTLFLPGASTKLSLNKLSLNS